ncbi:MAG: hypothetical protein DWQ42_21095 [Planctomycetota bacterium]|nr:MAG: hypothetical protein DWQ42_21095 [Planctomycetota bacterium]REK42330.1 MAG: hypothetical protein DWQ46_13755 [Planctomycetota bacterium]
MMTAPVAQTLPVGRSLRDAGAGGGRISVQLGVRTIAVFLGLFAAARTTVAQVPVLPAPVTAALPTRDRVRPEQPVQPATHAALANHNAYLLDQLQHQLESQAAEINRLSSRLEFESKSTSGYGFNDDADYFSNEWDYGLWFATPDDEFRFNVGGRLEQDYLWAEVDPELEARVGRIEDIVFFRRARMHIAGTLYRSLDYYLEIETADVEEIVYQDVWVQLRDVPLLGHIRAGHLKPPLGMESLTSAKFLIFLERDAVHDAFLQEYDPGVVVWNHREDGSMQWAVGMVRFDPEEAGIAAGNGKYSGVARLSMVPWSTECDESLLHIGGAARYNNGGTLDPTTGLDVVRFRARPEIRNTPRFVDTGPLEATGVTFVGGELGLKVRSLLFQGEYIHTHVHNASIAGGGPDLGSAIFDGYYFLVAYLLTGEQRAYSRPNGTFARLVPADNVHPGEDRFLLFQGAWELASRYSNVDLNDTGVDGGRLQTVTTGLTWYLNPNVKIMLNHIWARSVVPGSADNGESNLFGLRFHAAF